jgi:hypothetical protein
MSNRKRELSIELIIYFSSIILACLLWTKPYLLTSCYITISFAMLFKWHTKKDILYYFVAFILGPLGEIIAVYFRAWEYSKPFFIIPLWLPFLWGTAALFMMRLAETLIKNEKHDQ